MILLHKLSTLYLLLDGGKSDKLATRFASMGKIETILEEILTLLTPQLEWDTLNILCRNNVKSRKRKWIWWAALCFLKGNSATMPPIETQHNLLGSGQSWLKCQRQCRGTTMQRKRQERGSTGVVVEMPGAPEYVISDLCGLIQPTYLGGLCCESHLLTLCR